MKDYAQTAFDAMLVENERLTRENEEMKALIAHLPDIKIQVARLHAELQDINKVYL